MFCSFTNNYVALLSLIESNFESVAARRFNVGVRRWEIQLCVVRYIDVKWTVSALLNTALIGTFTGNLHSWIVFEYLNHSIQLTAWTFLISWCKNKQRLVQRPHSYSESSKIRSKQIQVPRMPTIVGRPFWKIFLYVSQCYPWRFKSAQELILMTSSLIRLLRTIPRPGLHGKCTRVMWLRLGERRARWLPHRIPWRCFWKGMCW